MAEPINFLTPVGRTVQGSLWEGRSHKRNGDPYTYSKGAKKGQPYSQFFIAIAILKTDPGWEELWAKIVQAAQFTWPQHFQLPTFSWKYRDGDSLVPNTEGRVPCEQEGFPGCHILSFTSTTPRPVYERRDNKIFELTDPSTVKRGYYIQINGSVVGNDSADKPGVYLNLGGALLIGYGPEIQYGPDGEAMFGNAPVADLPAGASAAPVAPSVAIPAGPSVAIPAGSNVTQQPVVQTHQAIQPEPGFMQPGTQPAQGDQKYNVNNQVLTRAQLIQMGYTPEFIMTQTPVQ